MKKFFHFIDIDECQLGISNCQKNCINIQGSFRCSCPDGFRLLPDGKSCEDINECLLRNGHGPCQDMCQNTEGSYKCRCRNGTHLASNGHSCTDLDECHEGRSGCSHGCISTHGRVYCTCPVGWQLSSNWKTCKGRLLHRQLVSFGYQIYFFFSNYL